MSQKLNSNDRIKQLDYNVVTGDTPTFYAGSSSSSSGNEEIGHSASEGASVGGLFSGLPSLPSILETIGSISNLKLPNIGLKMNWPSLGRLEQGHDILSAKRGHPSSGDQARGVNGPGNQGFDYKPPLWVQGPNGPVLNPEYIKSQAIPSLENAEKIYPSSILDPIASSPPAGPTSSSSNIRFPEESNNQDKRGGPNPDSFRFPDDSPPRNVDLRGQLGFGFIGVGPPHGSIHNKPSPVDSVPHRRRPLPSIVSVGPGQSSGTPFLPGLSSNQPNNMRQGISHIIGHNNPGIVSSINKVNSMNRHSIRDGNGNIISNIPQNNKKQPVRWSNPEVINPHSGVSLYQPSEQFKPYHPQNDNSPIRIITPPHSHKVPGLVPPRKPNNLVENVVPPLLPAANKSQLPQGIIDNVDILSYANPTENDTPFQALPIAPDLTSNQDNLDYKAISSTTVSAATTTTANIFFPDYDHHGAENIYSSTQAVYLPELLHSTTSPSYLPFAITETSTEASALPINISDDEPNQLGSILDLLYAAEKEVAQEQASYDRTLIEKNVTSNNDKTQNKAYSLDSFGSDILGQLPSEDDLSHLANSGQPHGIADHQTNFFLNPNIGGSQESLDLSSNTKNHPHDSIPPAQGTFSTDMPPLTMHNLGLIDLVPSTTPSLLDLTQRPPTIYGNTKKNNNAGIILSQSEGNLADFIPPAVGAGVSVLFENHKQDGALDGNRVQISPDLNEAVKGVNLEEEGLAGIDALDVSAHLAYDGHLGFKKLPTIAPEDFSDYSLFQNENPALYETLRYGGGGLPSDFTSTNLRAGPSSAGIGFPTISRVKPENIFTSNNFDGFDAVSPPPPSTTPDYTYTHDPRYQDYQNVHPSIANDNSNLGQPLPPLPTQPDFTYDQANKPKLFPPLTPALAPPPHLDKNSPPRVSLRQFDGNEQISEPKNTYERHTGGDVGGESNIRLGTLESGSKDGDLHKVSTGGLDWYFDNYNKDYGNNTGIPIGRNDAIVKSNSKSAVGCDFNCIMATLLFLLFLTKQQIRCSLLCR